MSEHAIKWLVWSIEHTAWWCAGGMGYMPYRDGAGRFTLNEAMCPDFENNLLTCKTT